ncbi:MAG: MFS transporter [Alphaproteobacteria bacterium]|nr:MFS transporter [Alphaproteobacteria bacterium]
MRNLIPVSSLAPFRVRSYRFQWPSDLFTSWAFEMETLILGWYVLVHTDSVLLLAVFGSLQFIGTLFSPMLGVVADKMPRRTVLCTMRGIFTAISSVLMLLALADLMNPVYVFVLSALAGIVRPSDLVVRNALIADTIPARYLTNAMGLSRATADSARIAGAIAGAGLFSLLGLGPALVVVTAFYAISFLLSLGVYKGRPGEGLPGVVALAAAPRSFWYDLKEGIAYVCKAPQILALMLLAFLINLTAFPVSHGLLPYVAREIYHLDSNGLAQLVAGFATGALIASIVMALTGGTRYSARTAFLQSLIWYVLLLLFSQIEIREAGIAVLVLIGMAQGFGMLAIFIALLTHSAPGFRARVMGVRSLAIYGLPIGLVAAGVLIERIGYPATVLLYAGIGIFFTVAIAVVWRKAVWD